MKKILGNCLKMVTLFIFVALIISSTSLNNIVLDGINYHSFWDLDNNGVSTKTESLIKLKNEIEVSVAEKQGFSSYDISALVPAEVSWIRNMIKILHRVKKEGFNTSDLMKTIENISRMMTKVDNLYLKLNSITNFNFDVNNFYIFVKKENWKNLIVHLESLQKEWSNVSKKLFKTPMKNIKKLKDIMQQIENTILSSKLSQDNKEMLLEKLFYIREKSHNLNILFSFSNIYLKNQKKLPLYFNLIMDQIDFKRSEILLKFQMSTYLKNVSIIFLCLLSLFLLGMNFYRGFRVFSRRTTKNEVIVVDENDKNEVISNNFLITKKDEAVIADKINQIIADSFLNLAQNANKPKRKKRKRNNARKEIQLNN